jgi:hypothetical protein
MKRSYVLVVLLACIGLAAVLAPHQASAHTLPKDDPRWGSCVALYDENNNPVDTGCSPDFENEHTKSSVIAGVGIALLAAAILGILFIRYRHRKGRHDATSSST